MFFGLILYLMCSLAHADVTKGEQDRLRSEMQICRHNDDWIHMNENFEALLKTHSKKHPLTFSDYVFGAYAAQELGRIHESVNRLQKALKIQPSSDEKDWLNLLVETSEYVSIKVSDRNRALVIDTLPDDIWLQKAINYAENRLNEDGRFQGRLPLGHYTYGDHEFTVAIGKTAKLSKIVLESPPKDPPPENPPPPKDNTLTPKDIEDDIVFAKWHARAGLLGFSYNNLAGGDSATVVSLAVGGSYRHPFLFDLTLEGSGNIFMGSQKMMGIVVNAMLKKRFNKLEMGAGYWGGVSLAPRVLPFNNSGFKPKEIYDHLQGTSGLGLSALYNLQPTVNIELNYGLSLNDGCTPWSDQNCYLFHWFQLSGVMAFP